LHLIDIPKKKTIIFPNGEKTFGILGDKKQYFHGSPRRAKNHHLN